MKPEGRSLQLLGSTRSQAKMWEYNIPEDSHINLADNPVKLFTLSIALLGDLAASINRGNIDHGVVRELEENLLFSAHFFDSYSQSRLNQSLDSYSYLMGAAAYYLCNLPGSSSVLLKNLEIEELDLDAAELEILLCAVLKLDFILEVDLYKTVYSNLIEVILEASNSFFSKGEGEERLIGLLDDLHRNIYEIGTPRELLIGDVAIAVLKKRIQNSTWKLLPRYSGINIKEWAPFIQKENFIKELWPGQRLLGEQGVFLGDSGVVQMPTSAGKTKSIEIILRSGFISQRFNLAVVIAPFRALCHEIREDLAAAFTEDDVIVNEFSDIPQADFDINYILNHQSQILVSTPEKLVYVLRQNPELASRIGLLIFDEGHQFDSGSRGITYELLLTSLLDMVSYHTQKILISAVINNAESIGEWMNGEKQANVVEGINLTPTYKALGFVKYKGDYGQTLEKGQIQYVDFKNINNNEFFVPRVIEPIQLKRKKGESLTNFKFFPNTNNGQAIALYLGFKLIPNGSVAIFCGVKGSVSVMCRYILDIYDRLESLITPNNYSNNEEVQRLYNLHVKNLGDNSTYSQCARLGIFTHHAAIPEGLRLAIEHGMRENLIKFVICTSTLAQGVNLPIRYLIVTSIYQAGERLKVRDFQNLIGRAGRSGMYTEGTVIFSDPEIFDEKNGEWRERKRWNAIKNLVNPQNLEDSLSNLLYLIEPLIINENGGSTEITDVAFLYRIVFPDIDTYLNGLSRKSFSNRILISMKAQFLSYQVILRELEGFLLANWEINGDKLTEEGVIKLAMGTLAYHQANQEDRKRLINIFVSLYQYINSEVVDEQKKVFSRTLLSIRETKEIQKWVEDNYEEMLSCQDLSCFIDVFWPLFLFHINNSDFQKFNNKDILKEIFYDWMMGNSFAELLDIAKSQNCKIGSRKVTIEYLVSICQQGFAYDGSLLIGAVSQLIQDPILLKKVQLFQKQIKYGLPRSEMITLYELGMADRVIAQDLCNELNIVSPFKNGVLDQLRKSKQQAALVLDQYPDYFHKKLVELLQ